MPGRTSRQLHARPVPEKRHAKAPPGLFRHLDPLPHSTSDGHVPAERLRARALLGPRVPLHILVSLRVPVRLARVRHHAGRLVHHGAGHTQRDAQGQGRQEERQKSEKESDAQAVLLGDTHVPGHAEHLRRLLQGIV